MTDPPRSTDNPRAGTHPALLGFLAEPLRYEFVPIWISDELLREGAVRIDRMFMDYYGL